MSDFVKELNFDGDTFNDMKRDMNFVLQRLLGNMQEKECQEGTLTLKLDVSLVREYVPNYNPNIPGESREIAKPKFSHKVTSQMKVEDMKKGNYDTEMELFLNEETGEYEMRPVADTTQRSIFDADYRDVTEPRPAGSRILARSTSNIRNFRERWQINMPFLAQRKNMRMQTRAYMTILRAITRRINNLLMKPI